MIKHSNHAWLLVLWAPSCGGGSQRLASSHIRRSSVQSMSTRSIALWLKRWGRIKTYIGGGQLGGRCDATLVALAIVVAVFRTLVSTATRTQNSVLGHVVDHCVRFGTSQLDKESVCRCEPFWSPCKGPSQIPLLWAAIVDQNDSNGGELGVQLL